MSSRRSTRRNIKGILIKCLIAYGILNLILGIAFVSAGGMQLFSSSTTPPVPESPTLASDLEYLREVVLLNEKDITAEQRSAFNAVLDNAPAPESVTDVTLTAMQALAVFDNAHTTVLETWMHHLPVRFHWTSNGLIIVKARSAYADLLGHKVLLLGGKPPQSLLNDISTFIGGGTESWRRYRSESLFSVPAALEQLGAMVNNESVELALESPTGQRSTATLQADEDPMAGDPFWDFRHSFPGNDSFGTAEWDTLLSDDQPLPLYLQQSDRLHVVGSIAEYDAVYLRMNASFGDSDETLDQLEQRVLSLIDETNAQNVIVDFRFNRGGDYTQVLPIVRATADAVPEQGELYLIVGPNTFSAGIIAASQYQRYLPDNLTIVGSEIGDQLRFRAEGFYPTLPASGIQLYLTKAWTDLANGCGWFDDCWPVNKVLLRQVDTLTPDIYVENTWASYRAAHDRVIEVVLQDIAGNRQPGSP